MNPQTVRANSAPGQLLGAVHEYYATGDRVVLRRALHRHDSKTPRMPAPERPHATVDAIYRGLLSFNLWPADADETYQAMLDDMAETAGDLSDAESIASHWRAVGEHLSYGIAKYADADMPARKTT